jgi:hypothetical protein
MSLYLRIIETHEIEELIDFEVSKLSETVTDEMDRQIASWNSRWRRESLNHYLPMGWSFLARDRSLESSFSKEGRLVGYFIAQPLLFFDGHTQNLWVEHLQFSALEARDALTDLAYRLSREKHFQKVFFPNSGTILNSIRNFKPEAWGQEAFVVKTAKL